MGQGSTGFGFKYKTRAIALLCGGSIIAYYSETTVRPKKSKNKKFHKKISATFLALKLINSQPGALTDRTVIKGFQFIDFFDAYEDSPKGVPTKLSLVSGAKKCVVEFSSVQEKEDWLSDLLRSSGDRPPQKIRFLKKILEQRHKKGHFWYKVKDLDPELGLYAQKCHEESFSKVYNFCENRAVCALLRFTKINQSLLDLRRCDFYSCFVGLGAGKEKKPCFLLLSGYRLEHYPDLDLKPLCGYILDDDGIVGEDEPEYEILTKFLEISKIKNLAIGSISEAQYCLKAKQFGSVSVQMYFETASELLQFKKVLENIGLFGQRSDQDSPQSMDLGLLRSSVMVEVSPHIKSSFLINKSQTKFLEDSRYSGLEIQHGVLQSKPGNQKTRNMPPLGPKNRLEAKVVNLQKENFFEEDRSKKGFEVTQKTSLILNDGLDGLLDESKISKLVKTVDRKSSRLEGWESILVDNQASEDEKDTDIDSYSQESAKIDQKNPKKLPIILTENGGTKSTKKLDYSSRSMIEAPESLKTPTKFVPSFEKPKKNEKKENAKYEEIDFGIKQIRCKRRKLDFITIYNAITEAINHYFKIYSVDSETAPGASIEADWLTNRWKLGIRWYNRVRKVKKTNQTPKNPKIEEF